MLAKEKSLREHQEGCQIDLLSKREMGRKHQLKLIKIFNCLWCWPHAPGAWNKGRNWDNWVVRTFFQLATFPLTRPRLSLPRSPWEHLRSGPEIMAQVALHWRERASWGRAGSCLDPSSPFFSIGTSCWWYFQTEFCFSAPLSHSKPPFPPGKPQWLGKWFPCFYSYIYHSPKLPCLDFSACFSY